MIGKSSDRRGGLGQLEEEKEGLEEKDPGLAFLDYLKDKKSKNCNLIFLKRKKIRKTTHVVKWHFIDGRKSAESRFGLALPILALVTFNVNNVNNVNVVFNISLLARSNVETAG